MSASTDTTSPATRFAGKRPSSTAGDTLSMTTRRRPSNTTSGTSPLRCELHALLASGEQRAASGEWVVELEQERVTERRQNVLVARIFRIRPREQLENSRPRLSEVTGGDSAVIGNRGNCAIFPNRAVAFLLQPGQERIGFSPPTLLLEGDGLIELISFAEPARSVFALGRSINSEQQGDDRSDHRRRYLAPCNDLGKPGSGEDHQRWQKRVPLTRG